MSIKQTLSTIAKDFTIAFQGSLQRVYPADGVDYIDGTLNGSTEEFKENTAYLENKLTILSGFLGWPNRKLQKTTGQSLLNLGKNFIGWQEGATTGRLFLNGFIMTPLNLLATPVKFVFNTIRLGTELLPATLAEFFLTWARGMAGEAFLNFRGLFTDKEKTLGNKIGLGALYLSTLLLSAVPFSLGAGFSFLHQFGAYLTSPLASIRNAWKIGRKAHISLAILLSGITAVGVVATYALALPLIAQAALPLVIYAEKLPKFILTALNAVSIAVEPALTLLGNTIMPAVTVLAKALTFGLFNVTSIITQMPAIVGLGAVFGGLLATVGTPISDAIDRFKTKWHTPRPQPVPDTAAPAANVGNSEMAVRKTLQAQPANTVENRQTETNDTRAEQKPAPTPTPVNTQTSPVVKLVEVKAAQNVPPKADEEEVKLSRSNSC